MPDNDSADNRFVKDDSDARQLYIELLKKAVLATLYDESSWFIMGSRPDNSRNPLKRWIKSRILDIVHRSGFVLAKPLPMTPEVLNRRIEGLTSGFFGHTMIGMHRLGNVQKCIEQVLADDVPGDIIETGAWRGGSTIFMRGMLMAHGVSDRTVWVADSFEGFPKIDADVAAFSGDAEVDVDSYSSGGPLDLWLSVPLEKVQASFERYGLLDDQVRFLKGWFEDTLPSAPIDRLAILRLDGDLYKSTMDALEALYHKVSPGGFVIVDDYYSWPHCKAAVEDFRKRKEITAPIMDIDQSGVYWRLPS